jgi:hypothetical protein
LFLLFLSSFHISANPSFRLVVVQGFTWSLLLSFLQAHHCLSQKHRFTSQSFLLNGMAIGFVSSIDDLLAPFFVREAERERIEEDLEEDGPGEGRWLTNRLYGTTLAGVLAGIVLNCEKPPSIGLPIWAGRLHPGFCYDCYATEWVLHSNRTQQEQVDECAGTEADAALAS